MSRACWRVGACTATAKRAVPERTSIEIFAIRIASSLQYVQPLQAPEAHLAAGYQAFQEV